MTARKKKPAKKKRARKTKKVRVRVIRIPHVPGRPAMNGPEHPTGADGWRLMTQLVRGTLAFAGLEARVERDVSRVGSADARRREDE